MSTEKKKTKKSKGKLLPIVLTGAVVAVLAAAGVGVVLHANHNFSVSILIDGEDYSFKSKEAAKKALAKRYPWALAITNGEATYEIEDMVTPAIDEAVNTVYEEAEAKRAEWDARPFMERFNPSDDTETSVTVTGEVVIPDLEAKVASVVEDIPSDWAEVGEDCEITGFDAASRTFTLSEGKPGTEVNKEAMQQAILDALTAKEYDAAIPVIMSEIPTGVQKSDYKIIGSFKTTTTASTPRNTNVRLASEAVDGTILMPGEQFSFNGVVGKRTPEKGYQQAPAYNKGETVMEYGGGVCQVSTTLYNAIIAANFDADDRTGHTFQPSYVTPGQDATVSFDKPDFKFTNNTDHPIGILEHYENRTVTAEIYGVPTLEEGVTRHLRSVRVEELLPPEPKVVEDPTIGYGEQVVVDGGTMGSVWHTYLVLEKDGQVISDEFLQKTKYRGHTPVIHVNTTVPMF